MGRIFEKRKHSIFKTALNNAKVYSRYSKQVYMAAKKGVPDPDANPLLRHVPLVGRDEQARNIPVDDVLAEVRAALLRET